MDKRVVITGMGVTTPIGSNLEDFWEALLEGKSGIGLLDRFDTSKFSCKIAAQVKGFDPEKYIPGKELQRIDLFVQYALGASQMAVDDSGLDLEGEDLNRIGVVVGSGIGGMATMEAQKEIIMERGPRRVSPFTIPMMIINMASGMVSIRFGAKGPNTTCVTACATGTHCIGEAFRIIQRDEASVMICGGTEASLTPLGFAGFCNMKALSTRNDDPEKASRPFDKERDGFIMGEGAGVVVLEELEHAKARGAEIYAEVRGFAMTSDAHHMTAPSPDGDGAARAITLALKDAGLSVDEIDYVNAHGTSTPLNDKMESQAIRTAFGAHADNLKVNSSKSMLGHLLGAAGGVEVVAVALSMKNNVIHPTMNYEVPDPECDLNYVPNQPVESKIRAAISNSLGFGGHNAVLAISRFE